MVLALTFSIDVDVEIKTLSLSLSLFSTHTHQHHTPQCLASDPLARAPCPRVQSLKGVAGDLIILEEVCWRRSRLAHHHY